MVTQLHDSFKPRNYRLQLDINSENLIFSGSVMMSGELFKNSATIVLHAKDLEIFNCTVNGVKTTFTINKARDELMLHCEHEVNAGGVEISIAFSGKITDAMHGMYPCYFEHEGKRKKLIATQFESHHAREVFPCIDEPAAKATFDLELITNKGEVVLSNMPIRGQKLVINNSGLVESSKAPQTTGSKLQTTFETTPVMSTYLLAFVAGEMVSKEAKTKDGVIVRSWASAAQDPSWLEYSVKEAVGLIEFYNEYFGVPYPLAKCDQVALPDFETGAMENWGLLTYRETVLLSDPRNVSLSTQQLISLVVAHELSHQWFGNLVTMRWWDDLWLNESFANMMEYLASNHLHPEWHIWEDFVAQDVIAATNRDVYKDVQPVRVAVNSPAEINTLFDPSIVYAKGGKLLKMLHDLLGDDAWRTGLQQYFEKYAYQNTTRDNLWEVLNHVSAIDVPELMNSWIDEPGQPLVSVSQQKAELKLSQSRLLLDGSGESTWHIPLLAKNTPLLFSKKAETFKLETESFVQLNQSGVGHYITNYTEPAHKEWISAQLSDPETSSEWKIAHLNSLLILSKHGDTSLSEALEAIKNSQDEPRAAVWSQISAVLGSSRMMIEGEEVLEACIKQLSYNLSKEHLRRLGWEYSEDEPSNDTHLRTTAISLAVASENEAILGKALELYGAAENLEGLPAETRSILMGVGVRFGKAVEFERLIDTYKTSSNADFKADISAALCSTKNPSQARHLTELMLDTSVVRTQDTIGWYVCLLRNRHVRNIAWQWLLDNWDWIMDQFGGSKSYDDFARYSAALFNSDTHLKQYKEFFEPKTTDPALKRAVAIGINEITARNKWRKRDKTKVGAWLQAYQSKSH